MEDCQPVTITSIKQFSWEVYLRILMIFDDYAHNGCMIEAITYLLNYAAVLPMTLNAQHLRFDK